MRYRIQQGSVSLGGEIILDHIDFEIKGNEKLALIGKNGSGKTTLLRFLAGELDPDRDDRHFGPVREKSRSFTIRYVPQIVTKEGEDGNGSKEALSGGEEMKRRLEQALLAGADLLLLDEPTNHLDQEGVEWLEKELKACPGAAVIVTHDRYFLDRVADAVYELSGGRLTRYAGGYSSYLEQKRTEEKSALKKYKAQQREIERLKKFISRFGHQSKKAAQAKSRKRQLERMIMTETAGRSFTRLPSDPIEPARRPPRILIEADKAEIGYQDPLCSLTFTLRRGRKIGIIGKNGAGKSTFLKTLTGEIPLIKGKLVIREGVMAGFYDQESAGALSDLTVLDHFRACFPGMEEEKLRSLLAAYGFGGRDALIPVSGLSGGERSRLLLAETIESRPNLLLLDEPTNHMDIDGRERIEHMLSLYTGTILFVTHDRYFLKKIADSLLIFSDNEVLYYPYGYDHYVEMLEKRRAGSLQGADPVAAENTRLLEGLAAVPDRERHQSARYSTEQSFADWQLIMAEEARAEAEAGLKKLTEDREADLRQAPDEEVYYRLEKLWEEREKELLETYTESCCNWYEKWLDYRDAFENYQDL